MRQKCVTVTLSRVCVWLRLREPSGHHVVFRRHHMFSLESGRYSVSLFSKHNKTSKCLLGAPQATVPVLIMESESSVTTQSEAVANYVVIMRRRTHLMTGLAQGRDGVSARVFWMSALPARSSHQAEGCAWFCFVFCYIFLCVTEDLCLSFGGWAGNEAHWTKRKVKCDRKTCQNCQSVALRAEGLTCEGAKLGFCDLFWIYYVGDCEKGHGW